MQRTYADRLAELRQFDSVGHSDNQCVTVTLDAAGPCGEVEADPGWLANAAPAAVAAAVQQAFEAAYEKRDQHG